MSSNKASSRRWLGGLSVLALLLTTAIGAVLLRTIDIPGVDRLQSDVEHMAPFMAGIRLLLIAGLFFAWPALLRFCTKRHWISAAQQQLLLDRRLRLTGWLLALELILGLEILNHVHSLLDGLRP